MNPLVESQLLIFDSEIEACVHDVLLKYKLNGLSRPVTSKALESILHSSVHALPDYVDMHKGGDNIDIWSYIDHNYALMKKRTKVFVKVAVFEFNMFGNDDAKDCNTSREGSNQLVQHL